MFGEFGHSLNIENNLFSVVTEETDQGLIYRRKCLSKSCEKLLNDKNTMFKLHPVEPVNIPKAITQHLFLEFSTSITVSPKSVSKIYLTYPLEIGVFVSRNSNSKHPEWHKLDVFSLHKGKYALYGEVWRGQICRYWNTPVLYTEPEHPEDVGIVRVTLTNRTSKWFEIRKLIIDTQFLKLYYVGDKAVCRVQMDVLDSDTAEITCKDIIRKGHVRAHELIPSKRGPLVIHRNTMEWGM